MFKPLKRKLALVSRKCTRKAEVYAVSNPRLGSASDVSPSPSDSRKRLLSKELQSTRNPTLVAKPGADIDNLTNPEDLSHLKLDVGSWSDDVETYRRPKVATQETEQEEASIKAQNHLWELDEDDISEFGVMKFVTMRKPGKTIQALLLTPSMYERTQALIRARQDLRVADSELTTTAAELENLIAAKSELEEQDDYEIPGAFFDDDAYADRERHRLLMASIEKKIGFCRQTWECREAQKPRLQADLEALQEQFFNALERAVRDDVAANALRAKVNIRKSQLSCGRAEIGAHQGP